MNASAELPRYRSHKEIHALKIGVMSIHEDNSATIVPADNKYAMFTTEPGWWSEKFKTGSYTPDDGGYYLVYPDGYKSWSPSKTFEEGYTRID